MVQQHHFLNSLLITVPAVPDVLAATRFPLGRLLSLEGREVRAIFLRDNTNVLFVIV